MVPDYYISESKEVSETISYFGNFSDVLVSGETISTQLVTVLVVTGTDPNPSNLLYEGISIHNGNNLEQRIRLGIPGCIYFLLFTITTSLGNTYERGTELAILPDSNSANPNHTVLWLTSWNYPYNIRESMQGYAGMSMGSFWYQPSIQESVQGGISLINGNLFIGSLTYNYVPEAIKGNISISSGTLILSLLTYNEVSEQMRGDVAVLYGNLYQGLATFNSPGESMQGNISINSGILI